MSDVQVPHQLHESFDHAGTMWGTTVPVAK